MARVIYDIFLYPHILLGFVSIGSFWGAVSVRKGSPLHVRCGKMFYWGMIGLSGSAFLMTIPVILAPLSVHAGQTALVSREFSTFLSYLAVLSITCVTNGRSYIKQQLNVSNMRSPVFLVLNPLTGVSALGILFYGFLTSNALFIALSIPGIAVASNNLRYLMLIKRTTPNPRSRLSAHMGEMIAGGIAVHTAFIAGGGKRFLPLFIQERGWWIWLIPSVVGILAIRLMRLKKI